MPHNHAPELTILPEDDLSIVRNRYLTHYELLERLNHYIDLCIRYGEYFLRHEEAQLCMDTNETLRKELEKEILMARISNIMDKINELTAQRHFIQKG